MRKVVFMMSTALLSGALFTQPVYAQEKSADELAKAAQNPLATMVTLPLQANWNNGAGDYERTFFNLNIQPVVPIPGENWNVITRTILPVNSAPVGETDSTFGLGDTLLQVSCSARMANGPWAASPATFGRLPGTVIAMTLAF